MCNLWLRKHSFTQLRVTERRHWVTWHKSCFFLALKDNSNNCRRNVFNVIKQLREILHMSFHYVPTSHIKVVKIYDPKRSSLKYTIGPKICGHLIVFNCTIWSRVCRHPCKILRSGVLVTPIAFGKSSTRVCVLLRQTSSAGWVILLKLSEGKRHLWHKSAHKIDLAWSTLSAIIVK